MKKLFEFLSEKVVPFGTIFLIFFIPVYPKLPILDIVGTWVYIRLEDFLIAILVGLFLLTRFYERKFTKSTLTIPIIFYWIVGAVSVVSSLLFIGPRVQNYFPHLVVLHYLRRIEYMMLFFLAYETVLRRKNVLGAVIAVVALATLVVILYGIGQKFMGFPAYLTMNEEFAKGVPLRLPPTARIVSTFGGHYDLGAYLVLIIPLLGSLALGFKKFWQKSIFLLLTIGSVVLLLFTASRISFGVYLVGITAMLLWHKKFLLIPLVLIASFILLNLVSGASERFYKTFRFSDVVVDLSTGKPIGTLDKIEGGSAVIEKIASPAEENLPRGSGYINVPPASQKKPEEQLKTVELFVSHDLATGSGEVATISGSFLIQKALVYDISITTRFQGEWPKAIEAFKRNMLLGSGYSTLSVAVDGNYHRMLGETGILGAISFLGIIAFAFALFLKGKNDLSGIQKSFVIGFFAGLVGLLLNAILIDIFEASKVAYTLWLLMGIVIALLSGTDVGKNYFRFLWTLLTSQFACMVYIVLVVFYVYRAALSGYFLGDDFTWLKWAAQSSFADIAGYFTHSAGFFYRPIPKTWYLLLYSIFWLKSGAYHVISLLLYSGVSLLIWSLLKATKVHTAIALLAAFLFGALAVHHENVFWISGYSSILGTLFLLATLRIAYWRLTISRAAARIAATFAIFLTLLLAMLSYDSLIISPLIFVATYRFIFQKRERWVYSTLLLIPLYWALRSFALAVGPSGDYGYKLAALPINSIANSIGYFLATFFGPLVIEKMQTMRSLLREYLTILTLSAVLASVIIVFIARRVNVDFQSYARSLLWFGCFAIACIPFAPLGGMAERYAFAPSAFLILFFASAAGIWINRGTKWKRSVVIFLLFLGLLGWNTQELAKVAKDWQFANYVSEQTLVKIKSEYFPLREAKTFIFVDTPIRFGRAWIFPTGLPDAMWHIFRQAPYTVVQVPTVKEAFDYSTGNSVPAILRFENYELKKLVAESHVVESTNEK